MNQSGLIKANCEALSALTWMPYVWIFTEQLSHPYAGQLYFIANKLLDQTEIEKLLFCPIEIRWQNQLGKSRRITGFIFQAGYITDKQLPDRYCYRLKVAPWMSALFMSVDYKNYVNQDLKTIVADVLAPHHIYEYDFSRLTKTYEPREYSVRYGDDGKDFLERLFYEAGIYYTFRHQDDLQYLVLHDNPMLHEQLTTMPRIYPGTTRPENLVGEGLWNWQSTKERIECDGEVIDIEPGVYFGDYWTDKVDTLVQDFSFFHEKNHEQKQFKMHISAVLQDQNYLPKPNFKRNLQTSVDLATVVGVSDKETYCDELGRIKVQFEWDRYHLTDDLSSSCWIPLKQAWGGHEHGTLFIPRKQQEVIVMYQDGDPEKPMVIGALANADNLPPFAPEQYPYRSGYKSHTPEAKDIKNGNVLMFDDDPSTAGVTLKAERDLVTQVAGNSETKIERTYHQTVQTGNYQQNIGGHLHITAKEEIRLVCGESSLLINHEGITLESPKIVVKSPPVVIPEMKDLTPEEALQSIMSKLDSVKVSATPQVQPPEARTQLAIRICDRYSQGDVDKAPDMLPLIDEMYAQITIGDYLVERKAVEKGYLILENFDQENIHKIKVQLLPGPLMQNQSVLIIAKNGEQLPCVIDHIKLKSPDWNKQAPTTDNKNVTTYHCELTLLEPAMLFNFRHDKWIATEQMDAESLANFNSVKSYFKEDSDSLASQLRSKFYDHEIEHFKHHGNNVTLFIHGYNVNYGYYGKNLVAPVPFEDDLMADKLSYTLFRDDEIIAKQTGVMNKKCSCYHNVKKAYSNEQKLLTLFGDGAHKWLTHMEYNLNKAAGFDGTDYTNYTRLVGIAWQGDGKQAYDYMATTVMPPFAAKKIYKLIQQLFISDIKINIMAHSLGNDVLMNVLELCANAAIEIDHVFMWQPAIPDNSYATQPRWYFPMPSQQNPQRLNPKIPYTYNFVKANKAAKSITVLYSDHDNILGEMPAKKNNKGSVQAILHQLVSAYKNVRKVENWGETALCKVLCEEDPAAKAQLTQSNNSNSGLVSLGYEVISVVISESIDNLGTLRNKLIDPGSGLIFVIIALALDVLDKYFVPLLNLPKPMHSIYHLANMFGYPLSFFLENTPENCAIYYDEWRKHYKFYQKRLPDGTLVEDAFMPTLTQQAYVLQQSYPAFYEAIAQLKQEISDLQKGKLPPIVMGMEALVLGKPAPKGHASLLGRYDPIENYVREKAVPYGNKLLAQYLKSFVQSSSVRYLNDHLDVLATTILSVLVTRGANPSNAMGYTGFDYDIADQFTNKYHRIDQGSILPDHDGMIIPSRKMMEEIYIKKLFREEKTSFDFFGKWSC